MGGLGPMGGLEHFQNFQILLKSHPVNNFLYLRPVNSISLLTERYYQLPASQHQHLDLLVQSE